MSRLIVLAALTLATASNAHNRDDVIANIKSLVENAHQVARCLYHDGHHVGRQRR